MKKIIKKIFSRKKKNNNENIISEFIKEQEKRIISNSRWWDALWYVKTYNHDFNRQEALDYWYETGWQKGESPSKYINLSVYKTRKNPILAYMGKNIEGAMIPDRKNNFKSPNDKREIEKYLEYKKTRQSKSVVYTCISNDYDDICELETYAYINHDWDYVCFTDNQEHINQGQIGIWQMRPLQFNELDPTRNNRWHKINPHLLFKEYDESIYIDSNINILSDFLFKLIKEKNADFVLPRHFKNQCIYSEYKDCLGAKLDNEELILSELNLLLNDDMPKNYGFCENNILYRKHNKQNIINLMNSWWDMIKTYAKRDQLSLCYLLWKNGINIEDITFENSRFLIDDFYVFGHKKGRGN